MCSICSNSPMYACNQCSQLFCNHHAKIGLYIDLSNESKTELDKMPLMWMHGTRTPVLTYIDHMKDIKLEPGVYSSGVLYRKFVYPMSGALGGDLTSKQENVGKELVSGVLNSPPTTIDRPVYYTTYGEQKITLEQLDNDLKITLNSVTRYGLIQFQKVFGGISRIRYWDDTHYTSHWKNMIISDIVPILIQEIESVEDQSSRSFLYESLNKIVYADEPVIQFTNKEKTELNNTYPIIFCSERMVNEVIPKEEHLRSAEPNEVYVKQLLMKDVDVVFTTNEGYDFVVEKMKQYRTLVIAQNDLFHNANTLTGFAGPLMASQTQRMNQWKETLPSMDIQSLNRLFKSGFIISDFEGSSMEEIRNEFEELSIQITDDQIMSIINANQ